MTGESLSMMRPSDQKSATARAMISATASPVTAVQINRAIQNVLINAVQASADRKGAVLVDCTQRDFYVDIRVEDTGRGIPKEQVVTAP